MIATGCKRAPTMLLGHAPDFVRRALARRSESPEILGIFPSALYVQLASREVIAVLSSDAVALPIGIVINREAARLPWLKDPGQVSIAEGTLHIAGLRIRPDLARSSRMPFVGEPDPSTVRRCREWLGSNLHRFGLDPGIACTLTGAVGAAEVRRAVAAAIGRGPGLTPAGDDLLCGLLAGAQLFGRECGHFVNAVETELANRPRATTALSRQLLLRACAGDGLPQLRELGSLLVRPVERALVHNKLGLLTAIGHTSGIALLAGLLASVDLDPDSREPHNRSRS